MLNTPNEWHNEEDIEEYTEEEYSEEYEENVADDEFSEESYSEDEEYTEDEEYAENTNGGLDKKKIIIMAVSAVLVLILLIGGIFAMKAAGSKNVSENQEAVEMTDNGLENGLPVGEEEITFGEEENNALMPEGEDEIAIDVEEGAQEDNNMNIAQQEPQSNLITDDGSGLSVSADAPLRADDASNLQVNADNSQPVTGGQNGPVTVSIGDMGRQNPFMPKDRIGMVSGSGIAPLSKKDIEESLNFEVIEPPVLREESPEISRLLRTKVSGILYDPKKPSAIINIDGIDQLVKPGDILSDFEIISITKNKVVISSDNNVYRASVGQPLNAELVDNHVEISNLETKFKGSKKIN